MLDPGLLELKGARVESRYTSLATLKFISGLMTQRSPFAGIDTRYNGRFLGGRPDALIAGSNMEISSRLTLVRRAGLVAYGTSSIPTPLTFYMWDEISPFSTSLMVDTASYVYTYSPTYAGVYLSKAAGAGQTNFMGLVNSLFMADGKDLYKIVGPNLLLQSNTFTNAAWTKSNATPTAGQADPVGGTAATQIIWGTTGATAFVSQGPFSLNYTPVGSNTFTFSIYLKSPSGETVTLSVQNQAGTTRGSSAVTPGNAWVRYQVTATMASGDTQLKVVLGSPTNTNALLIYGAQVEVGGPSKPVEITAALAQGMYLWGIVAPASAPTFTTPGGAITAATGYQYYYAYLDDVTGQPSNVSPISAATGPLAAQNVALAGVGSADPQVTKIAIYRNLNGGAFFYQLTTIANPGVGAWAYTDSSPDSALNQQIFAPIGLLNTPPPAGALDPVSHAGRYWLHVNNLLYYSSGSDNAAVLHIVLNGSSVESWGPGNVIPFDAAVVRKLSTAAGLLVWTIKDLWLVTGADINSPFTPVKILSGHGLRTWNAMDVDGSTILALLSDKQFVSINPGTGSLEIGFPIGDQIEANVDSSMAYVARHIAGSQDNAVFLGNGSTGWYRVNPNQAGASVSGEQTEVWSPFATIAGGCVALCSTETSPGVFQLLVGQNTVGPVLARSLSAFTDNGTPYAWYADIGSIVLATPGQLAEVESLTIEQTGTQVTVAVLLDEISETYNAPFETLTNKVDDPPQLAASQSLLSKRFYLSQGTAPPICRHMQIRLSGGAVSTKDEVLSLSIRGVLVPEQ